MIHFFAGIIFDTFYKSYQVVDKMLDTCESFVSHKHQILRKKNLCFSCFAPCLYSNPRLNIHLISTGDLENEDTLAKELEITGTYSQSQVILTAYERWHLDCFARLKGNVCVSIYDGRLQKVFILRDRIGEQSIYWYQDSNHFIFASDLKSLLASGLIPQKAAKEALASYLYLGHIPQDQSPVRNVNKLLPGYYLQHDLEKKLSIHSYWSYSQTFKKEEQVKTDPQFSSKLTHLLEKSIESKTLSSGGAPLSINLSSNISSCLLLKELETQELTVSSSSKIGGKNSSFCHRFIQEKHSLKELPLQAKEFAKDFVQFIWFLGEPIANPELIHEWNFIKNAVSKSSLILSPFGGDILLGAPERYFCTDPKRHIEEPYRLPFWRKYLLKLSRPYIKKHFFSHLRRAQTNPSHLLYLKHTAYFNKDELSKLSPFLSKYFVPDNLIQKFYHMYRDCSEIVTHSYFDVKTFLVDGKIAPLQHIAHAFGKSACFPFLDEDLMSFIAQQQHASDAEERQNLFLVNTLLHDYFAYEKEYEPKLWKEKHYLDFLDEAPWPEAIQLLSTGILVATGLLNRRYVKRLCDNKKKNYKQKTQIWSLLCLEAWYRLFIYLPLPQTIPEIELLDLLNTK
jgi:asparagine synthase (glutamine-hydrolysing)